MPKNYRSISSCRLLGTEHFGRTSYSSCSVPEERWGVATLRRFVGMTNYVVCALLVPSKAADEGCEQPSGGVASRGYARGITLCILACLPAYSTSLAFVSGVLGVALDSD